MSGRLFASLRLLRVVLWECRNSIISDVCIVGRLSWVMGKSALMVVFSTGGAGVSAPSFSVSLGMMTPICCSGISSCCGGSSSYWSGKLPGGWPPGGCHPGITMAAY